MNLWFLKNIIFKDKILYVLKFETALIDVPSAFPVPSHPTKVEINALLPSERYYLPQETGNYSVAGFRMVMNRKVSHYIITYYIPSGLFVVVSWASFLIPCDDIQVRIEGKRIFPAVSIAVLLPSSVLL